MTFHLVFLLPFFVSSGKRENNVRTIPNVLKELPKKPLRSHSFISFMERSTGLKSTFLMPASASRSLGKNKASNSKTLRSRPALCQRQSIYLPARTGTPVASPRACGAPGGREPQPRSAGFRQGGAATSGRRPPPGPRAPRASP